jgi:hypothetical protein
VEIEVSAGDELQQRRYALLVCSSSLDADTIRRLSDAPPYRRRRAIMACPKCGRAVLPVVRHDLEFDAEVVEQDRQDGMRSRTV